MHAVLGYTPSVLATQGVLEEGKMKILMLLLFSLSLCAGDIPPRRTQVASVSEYTNYLNIAHPQGPIRVRVELRVSAYPLDNEVDVILRIFQGRQLITTRNVTLFW